MVTSTGTAGRDEREAPEIRGTAGYVSPYPYLDLLQSRMEERLARKVPVKGRFCGFCYARLKADQARCPYCEREISKSGTVDEIPQDVLTAYKARQKTEAAWVHFGAFFGLIIASGIFLWQVIWAPGLLGHPAVAFSGLILGGYLLAQVFGPILGGQFGYRKGSQRRDRLWANHLEARDGSAPKEPAASQLDA